MQQLSPEGQHLVNNLAQRHGFSSDAVAHMFFAVLNGNSTMAQFSHSEFGGGGQWLKGGMIMLGDMFNNHLKGRVDSLCNEICGILASQPGLLRTGSFQSQNQSGSEAQTQANGSPLGQSRLFLPDPRANWWPAELGFPNATGEQNNVRYAYFASSRRLAVESASEVWVYDTLDHQIGGFSQQQGMGTSITFNSQFGTVNLSSLPVVFRNGRPVAAVQPQPNASSPRASNSPAGIAAEADIFSAIERLGDLKAKGFLTEQEFAAKKAELLARL